MGAPDAEALEKEYEKEMAVANGDVVEGVRTRVEMLPTLDAQGRLYDVGQGKNDAEPLPGNRKKKEKSWKTWGTVAVPELIPLYLRLLLVTENLQNAAPIGRRGCGCQEYLWKLRRVACVHMDRKSTVLT